MRQPLVVLLCPVILVMAASLLTSCDAGATITWVNRTDLTIEIYLGEDTADFGHTQPPHSTKRVDMIRDLWKDVVVGRDSQGNVLVRMELTWDELEAQDFRIVIEEEDIR